MSIETLTPTFVEGELRILDTDLAERLGFERPRDIRKIITRWEPDLDRMGQRAIVARSYARPQGGTVTVQETYLNRKQAIFITAKSETERATDITIEIIERFDAYERGAPAIHIPKTMAEALRLAADQAEQIERQSLQIAAAQPKVEGFDRLANSEGMFQLRVAAKLLDWPERKFIERLHAMEWIYKLKTGGNWIAHADKLRSAVLVHKSYTHTDEAGDERTRHQVFVTPKGLARLSLLLGEYAPSGSRGPDTPGDLPPAPPPVQPNLGLGHGATP